MSERREQAIGIMERYAERTGLSSEHGQRRYLWTDAFAVCNFLGLSRAIGRQDFSARALTLIDAVHTTLGRHRDDDERSGWLSGLNDVQAVAHPTRAGLRIGKRLPERAPDEPLDDRLEWDRDGQYFHYLTKWMHALDQAARSTGEWTFNLWARELADAAFDAFTYRVDGSDRRRMFWKMSIDLSRPLILSMGQHDPLDGYVTYIQLQATARAAPAALGDPHVADKADQLASAIAFSHLQTADPLGLGGLLFDAARIEQLSRGNAFRDDSLVELLLAATADGLAQYAAQGELRLPAERRLPFRELGLAIGLHAVRLIADGGASSEVSARLEPLMGFMPLLGEIESFWSNEEHQRVPTWTEHQDINDVMLATTLEPQGFLVLHDLS